jgi:hypothetical protein
MSIDRKLTLIIVLSLMNLFAVIATSKAQRTVDVRTFSDRARLDREAQEYRRVTEALNNERWKYLMDRLDGIDGKIGRR